MYNAKPGRPSRTYLRRGRCFASARRQTSQQTAAYPSLPVPGHNVGRAFTPAAAALRHHTAPQTSKASPARGGAAAGGGGVPHLALPIPSRLAAHAPPPPNLTANCRLSVAARSRPQCRAGVHARRSALASPHPAANLQSLPCKGRCRRRRRRGAAPRTANTLPARGTRPPPHTCAGADALHRPAAKPRGKLPLIRRCPFPATM